MSTPALLLSRFPPAVPQWPGALLGLASAVGIGYARSAGHWPASLPLPPGNHLHPLALFGHGLTLALLFTLLLEWRRLRPRWRQAENCEPGQPHWAGVAVRDCLDVLPARCTFKAYEKKLLEIQERWTRKLDRRWLWYYCAALALFVPGAVLVPLGLRPGPQPQPDPVTLFEPLAVAALETVVVFLLALRVRILWGDVLQTWVETALEGQKRNARLRRRRSDDKQTPLLQPHRLEAPPPLMAGHPTPLPGDSVFAIPLGREPAEAERDEVELVFDNDVFEDPEGRPL